MAKFVIKCPKCGVYHEASTGLFAKKNVTCSCGYEINFKTERFITQECLHCGNTVIYDQREGTKAVCPVCKNKLVTDKSQYNFVDIVCPSCALGLHVDKNAKNYSCPLCKTNFDVQEQILKNEIRNSNDVSVIKYEGTNDVLVYKHPIEDFNAGTQLIVHESQEAIFFRDGQALDSFGAGRYTLTTNKIPKLKDLAKLPFDSNIAFHSEIYFLNLTVHEGIKWGTDTKVRIFDPYTGISIDIGAYGEFSLKIINTRKILLNIVGTTQGLNNQDIINEGALATVSGKFKSLIITKAKSVLAKTIKESKINILEIDQSLDSLSSIMKAEINKILDDYGLFMPEFYILKVQTPDDDPNFKKMRSQYSEKYLMLKDEEIKSDIALAQQKRQIIEAQTNAQANLIEAQAKAEAYRLKAEAEAKEMQMKGYSYDDETKRQVSVAAMENLKSNATNSCNDLLSDAAKIGLSLGTLKSFVDVSQETIMPLFSNVNQNNSSKKYWNCKCGQTNLISEFCPNCGSKKVSVLWDCPNCGEKNLKSNFCPNCGLKKPTDKE